MFLTDFAGHASYHGGRRASRRWVAAGMPAGRLLTVLTVTLLQPVTVHALVAHHARNQAWRTPTCTNVGTPLPVVLDRCMARHGARTPGEGEAALFNFLAPDSVPAQVGGHAVRTLDTGLSTCLPAHHHPHHHHTYTNQHTPTNTHSTSLTTPPPRRRSAKLVYQRTSLPDGKLREKGEQLSAHTYRSSPVPLVNGWL